MSALFARVARKAADLAGSPYAFLAALLSVLAWTAAGWLLGFSDMVLLVGNTGMSIVSYLMLFLIQGAANRDQAEVLTTLRQMARDLADVDDAAIAAQIKEHS